MKFLTAIPIALAVMFPGFPGAASAQGSPSSPEAQSPKLETDADWKPLTEDASRAELFKRVIAAKLAEIRQAPGAEPKEALPGTTTKPFLFPQDANFDAGKPRENSIFGLDISHYTTPDLDFGALKEQGIRFVFTKATQGTGFKDARFAEYWGKLGSLAPEKKVLRGAYHFLSSSGDPAAQADSFLKFIALHGGFQPGDLPAVLDLEWDIAASGAPDRWIGQSPGEILDKTLAWLKKVEDQTGKIPILYTARSWWRERDIPEADFAKLAHYKIWIADYSASNRATETPGVPQSAKWHLWQFSEGARLSRGYSGTMDANIYKGSEAEFLAEFQMPPG
jgi:lysozyme